MPPTEHIAVPHSCSVRACTVTSPSPESTTSLFLCKLQETLHPGKGLFGRSALGSDPLHPRTPRGREKGGVQDVAAIVSELSCKNLQQPAAPWAVRHRAAAGQRWRQRRQAAAHARRTSCFHFTIFFCVFDPYPAMPPGNGRALKRYYE